MSHVREKTELSFYSFAENGITKSLLYEGAIKEYAAKNVGEKVS